LLGAFWKPPGPETCPPWAYFQPQTFTQPAISDHEARRPVGREGAKKDEIEKRFPARVRALQNGPADSRIPGFPDSRIPGFPDSRIPGFPPRTARGSGPSRDSFNVNERFREARTFCMGARARLRACTSALCGARVTCARLRLCGARIGHVIIADRICRYSSFR
jgi:hypothetical protein